VNTSLRTSPEGSRTSCHPSMTVWNRAECETVHAATLRVLSESGIDVRHAAALCVLQDAGAEVRGTRVRFPHAMVGEALASAPPRFTLEGRASGLDLTIGTGETYFGTGPDCLYVLDLDSGERRPALIRDVEDMSSLCELLPGIDFVMSMALPRDVEAETADLVQLRAMLSRTRKPIIVSSPRGGAALREMWELAGLYGGERSFACLTMPSPPLQLDFEAVDKLMACARLGIPAILAPAPSAGTTAPLSVASTVLVGNAEVLAGLIIHQLTAPGAPFVYGVGCGVMDMRTSVDAYCRPEHFLGNHAACDVGRFYGLPTWSYAGVSDSKIPDAQWAAEGAMTTLLGGLSRADLLHDVGYLESGMQSSCETLVLGHEFIGYVRRLFAGVPTDLDSIALDEIRSVGPGGNHLGRNYTRRHSRDFWRSALFDHRVFDRWEAEDGQTLEGRVRERTRHLRSSMALGDEARRDMDRSHGEPDQTPGHADDSTTCIDR